ncbi:MAG: DUF3618 domain-containing protein [Lautropia sp.]
MATHSTNGVDRDPRAIEHDIDHIRGRIGSTVDELEARLSPNHFIDQAIRTVREHGGEAAGNFGAMVKQNPVALLMVGAGLAWLMRGPGAASAGSFAAGGHRRRAGAADARWPWPSADDHPGEAGWRDRTVAATHAAGGAAQDTLRHARETASQTRDRIGGAASRVSERARHAAGSLQARAGAATDTVRGSLASMRDGASDLGQATRHGYEDLRDGFARLLDEQPLVVGAVGLAVGAAIGGMAPRTRREDRMMGGVRDDFLRQAADEAASRYDALRAHVAQVSGTDTAPRSDGSDDARRTAPTPGSQTTRTTSASSAATAAAGEPPTSAGGSHRPGTAGTVGEGPVGDGAGRDSRERAAGTASGAGMAVGTASSRPAQPADGTGQGRVISPSHH